MTTAHSALIKNLMTLLDQAPDVSIGMGPLPGNQLGHVHYPSQTITISDRADLGQFTTALTYAIVSLLRGPAYTSEPETEDDAVMEETARRLMSPSTLPPDADPHQLAHEYGVDVPIARLAIELARRERAEGVG